MKASGAVPTREEVFVIEACARAFGIDAARLRCRGKERMALLARTACYRLMRGSLDLSLPRIGAVLNRDHTTVRHGAGEGFARSAWSDSFVERFERANAEVSAALDVPRASVPPRVPGALPLKAIVRIRRQEVLPPKPDPFAGLRFEDHPRSTPRRFSVSVRPTPAAAP